MTTQIEHPTTPTETPTPPIENQKPAAAPPIENPPYLPLFPRGRFSLLIGDPGTGKSLLAAHLAARRSLRSMLPPEPFDPHPIPAGIDLTTLDPDDLPGLSIICPKEDDDQTLKLRLNVAAHGASADRRFIRWFESTSLVFRRPTADQRLDHAEGAPELRYAPLLASLMRLIDDKRQTVSLLILDPLPAFLENIDASNNPALIRCALEPLLNFTSRHGITVIGITHLAKSGKPRNPLFQAASSFAYTALARSVTLLTHDTLTHKPLRRLLIPLKNSFGIPSCAYSLTLHGTTNEHVDISIPYLTLDETPVLNHPLLPAFSRPARQADIPDTNLQLAEYFLQTTLAEGPLPSAQLLSEARSLGISTRTLARARDKLAIASFRTQKCWYSHLPSPADPDFSI